jgi:hypothetical protein
VQDRAGREPDTSSDPGRARRRGRASRRRHGHRRRLLDRGVDCGRHQPIALTFLPRFTPRGGARARGSPRAYLGQA